MKNEIKALKISLPSGGKFTTSGWSWDKRGGYLGAKMLAKVTEQLRKKGWEEKHEATGSPDGNVMGTRSYYEKNGWRVDTSRSYGVTKADNWFYINLTRVKIKS